MSLARSILITVLLSAVAAALGVWAGVAFLAPHDRRAPGLHEMVHVQLHLSADQERRLEALERDHAIKRRALEAEMRAANAALAQAYQTHHAYTPEVQGAIARFHGAMGAMQKESVTHVIAMRALLTPEQAVRFDDKVVRSLTDESP